MASESKKDFEDQVELESKDVDAAMYLPDIVGSFCQRILDLGDKLQL